MEFLQIEWPGMQFKNFYLGHCISRNQFFSESQAGCGEVWKTCFCIASRTGIVEE